jgi:hypothetical protein
MTVTGIATVANAVSDVARRVVVSASNLHWRRPHTRALSCSHLRRICQSRRLRQSSRR